MKPKDHNLKLIALAIASALLTACAIGPDYKRPELAVPATYKEIGDWKIAEPNDAIPRGRWWTVFNDPQLDALVEKIDVSNQTLKVSEARYRQAVALAQSARSSYLPTISANASSTRSRAAPARSGPGNDIATSHSLTANLNWELDVWGKIRRQVESGNAGAEASAADLEAARLSLQSELAISYFQLRVNDTQKQLLDETVAAYQKSLDLTRNRYAVGVAGKSDVVQAETQLYSAQAQAIDLGVQRAQLEHSIAVLIGLPPSEFSLPSIKWTAVMPKLPVVLPATLLERRPDVAAAERRAVSANAQIGVARAAYFPTLSFSSTLGYTSSILDKWISAPNRFWSMGPSLAETLFDFGKRGSASDQAVATYDQNIATYRLTVLEAFQDVEDNLASLRILEAEDKVQQEAVRVARESVNLTVNQYKAGTVSYLSVVTVQTAQLSNERTAVSLLGRRLSATVGLIKALGGGWSSAELTAAK